MFHNKPIFQDFEFGSIYYVSSRVNGGGVAFQQAKDYSAFLKLLKHYLLPICEVYAYVLCPKSFDIVLCIKSKNQMFQLLSLEENVQLTAEQQHEIVLPYFERFLDEYQQYFQSHYSVQKPLFGKFLKRIKMDEEEHLKKLLKEIHLKPQQLGETSNFEDWKYSSYASYLSQEKTSAVERSFLLQFFQDKEDFIQFHKE